MYIYGMTTNTDIAVRLLEAYDNMGTASRDDLKEAAEEIAALREKCIAGNTMAMRLIASLAKATDKSVDEIVTEHRWSEV